MNKLFRIEVGSILCECNHLGGTPTDLGRFEKSVLRRGAELRHSQSGSMGGWMRALERANVEIVPLLEASACPGGPLTAHCRRTLHDEMIERLCAAGEIDGVGYALHGSASADDFGDVEGELLRATREVVGENVAVVASLDTHGNVTREMVENADALVAFETYPHVDTFETGERGARLLLQMLRGELRPAMALAKVPVLVSGVHGTTKGEGAFAALMRQTRALEKSGEAATSSLMLVHPYLDLPHLGGGAIVVTDGDEEKAVAAAEKIARQYWDVRHDLDVPAITPAEAIRRGQQIEGGPIILIECADCTGGGATGDSAATLRALLGANVAEIALVPIVDPEAAGLCHQAGEGAEITLALGHKLDLKWGEPLQVTGTIEKVSNGRFLYEGGLWGGEWGEMGATAVLKIGAIRVLITSNATYEWAGEQFRALDLDDRRAKWAVAKNPMNFHLAYGEIARAAFVLDTPGPTPATLRGVRHSHVARPYFPADEEIPDLQPAVVRGVTRELRRN